jgi:hypothetical protein
MLERPYINSCGTCDCNPCGCKHVTPTTTMIIEYECDSEIDCEEVINSQCVLYTGNSSVCLDILKGDKLNNVLLTLFEKASGFSCSCGNPTAVAIVQIQ